MNYYFQPSNQAYSAEQIQGLTGINPEVADDEILNHHGIFRVIDRDMESDVFASPSHFGYKVKGCCAYKVSSAITISLEEAKIKARDSIVGITEARISGLREDQGFPPEIFQLFLQQKSARASTLKKEIASLIAQMESILKQIEETEDIDYLRAICEG